MKKVRYKFSAGSTEIFYDGRFDYLKKLADPKSSIIITDKNVYEFHSKKFSPWNTIVLKAGEKFKVQSTADSLINQLIKMGADRSTTLVGAGGGVITDLTGYVASVYMRGIRFGFIPTTVLGLVDASIGGKNGIDVGDYKNMVGLIRQPDFILHDMSLLRSLPEVEWENGFAEIIKHACIKDIRLFGELEKRSLKAYRKSSSLIAGLVQRNASIKIKTVQRDEFEKGERRLLNFGHTLGHALETQYELSHGHAISIGMTYASHISEELAGFRESERVVALLEKYNLPTYAAFDKEKVFAILKMDKKRVRKTLHYVLLNKIGKGVVKPVALSHLEKIIRDL